MPGVQPVPSAGVGTWGNGGGGGTGVMVVVVYGVMGCTGLGKNQEEPREELGCRVLP